MPHYLVTGASSGIGAALATALLRRGDKVTAMARREDRLAALDDSSGNFHGSACDVTDAAALAKAIEDAVDKQGPVDYAILNAGMYVPQDSLRIDPAVYARHMNVNYMGVVNALPTLIAGMAARRSGQIAIVSSVAGWRGLPKAAAYSPTKAALISLAESLYFDLTPKNIKIQIMCPGFVDTDATAVNDFDMPDLLSVETAADHIISGMQIDVFSHDFPKSFTRKLKFLRYLPDRLYFALVGKQTGAGS